ncbi:hypothetical protein [Thermofilum sp.]
MSRSRAGRHNKRRLYTDWISILNVDYKKLLLHIRKYLAKTDKKSILVNA